MRFLERGKAAERSGGALGSPAGPWLGSARGFNRGPLGLVPDDGVFGPAMIKMK